MTPDRRASQRLTAEATALLKVLAHPAHLMTCCELRGRELSIGNIATTPNIKQPRLSRELAKLREAGAVAARREPNVIFYSLSKDRRVAAMVDAISTVMLDGNSGRCETPGDAEELPRNAPGGYGVFARTAESQRLSGVSHESASCYRLL